jgi:nicotinate-nucleotide pyrophosphorylase (carboxylating)
MALPRSTLTNIVRIALDEDLGRGDLTTEACVAADATGKASLRAREAVVFCGAELVREVFAQVDPRVRVEALVQDGARAAAGSVLMTLEGRSRSLLEGERVALNFAQRLSGIATLTRAYVDAIPSGASTRITDTRKTTPGLRALERYAVRCGGGHNHREDLSSAVLIKDNHIAASGGIEQAIARARERAPHTSRIECEVESMSELDQALAAGADVVLLDNFADSDLDAAVARVAGRALIEVSGRVSLERVTKIAKAGVSVISVGALTHSARAVDLGLDWEAGA